MSPKTLSLALAATAALALAAPAAQARDGIGPGGAAALGVLGGLAVGSAIGAGAAQGGYYPGRPVAVAPGPAYGPPPAYVEEECFWRKRRFYDDYGNMIVRRERVCE